MNSEPRLSIIFGHQRQPTSEARLIAIWKHQINQETDPTLVKCERGHTHDSNKQCTDCWAQRDRHTKPW